MHIGHSTGGGELAQYVAPSTTKGRAAKAVLISAVPPVMVRTDAKTPAALPIEAFDGLREATGANRAQFYIDLASLWPVLRLQPSRREDVGGHHAQLVAPRDDGWGPTPTTKCIKAFSETDFTDDLQGHRRADHW